MRLFYLNLILIIGCIKNPSDEGQGEPVIDINSSWLIKINDYYCTFDKESKIMLFPIDSVYLNAFNGVIEYSDEHYDHIYINGIMVNSGENFNFGNIEIEDTIEVIFKIDAEELIYTLHFTKFPTVMIFTEEVIVDEPKILSRLIINDLLLNKTYDTHAGIEIRGGTSQNYPKVSYDLELLENEIGSDIRKEELFGLRNDENWHLDAMYIDLSRSRNMLGMKTWSSFARANYLVEETKAKLYQRGHLIELFHNNVYLGVYSFNEQIDKKQLQLKKNGGLLYKAEGWTSETTYSGIDIEPDSSLYWSGFELKHPEEMNLDNWEILYDFIHLVAYADDNTFINYIEEVIDIGNSIDYFIFINLIQANDNTGKNMFICRYDEGYPLFFAPWDLDLTFGNTNSVWTAETSINILLSNNLYNRLYELDANDYRYKVKSRWNEIYQNNIYDYIINDLSMTLNKIIESNVDYRENTRWNLETDYFEELNNISEWLSIRLIVFDNYISTNY